MPNSPLVPPNPVGRADGRGHRDVRLAPSWVNGTLESQSYTGLAEQGVEDEK